VSSSPSTSTPSGQGNLANGGEGALGQLCPLQVATALSVCLASQQVVEGRSLLQEATKSGALLLALDAVATGEQLALRAAQLPLSVCVLGDRKLGAGKTAGGRLAGVGLRLALGLLLRLAHAGGEKGRVGRIPHLLGSESILEHAEQVAVLADRLLAGLIVIVAPAKEAGRAPEDPPNAGTDCGADTRNDGADGGAGCGAGRSAGKSCRDIVAHGTER
jgi:hypothetical protein